MSISDRLNDARLLYSQGHKDGALLSVLIAVAATSRKRYCKPQFTDRDAFTKFVADEMAVITGGGVKQFNVRVPGSGNTKRPEEMMPMGVCLYEFVRCNLAHEAALPDNVAFVAAEHGSLSVDINDERIALSESWIDGLSRAVTFAPENADLFPDHAEMPEDVIAWMLFGKRRDNHSDYMLRRAERFRANVFEQPS